MDQITYELIEIAKLESAITGVIAGFAFTVVILLIERLASKDTDISYNASLGKAAILIFIGAFFLSTLASFLYAITGGEKESPKVFFMTLFPGIVFSMSVIYLTLGILLLLGAFNLDYVLKPTTFIFYGTLVVIIANYLSAALGALSINSGLPPNDLFRQPTTDMALVAIIVFCFVFWLFYKKSILSKRMKKQRNNLPKLDWFFYGSLGISALAGSILPMFNNTSEFAYLPSWIVFLTVFSLAFFAGWATIYIPDMGKKS